MVSKKPFGHLSTTPRRWKWFLSEAYLDIWDHMSEDEQKKITDFGKDYAFRNRWRGFIPSFLFVMAVTFCPRSLFWYAMLACLWLVCSFIPDPRERAYFRELRTMLCSTSYAQERGIQPQGLRLFRWLSFA